MIGMICVLMVRQMKSHSYLYSNKSRSPNINQEVQLYLCSFFILNQVNYVLYINKVLV